MNIFALDNDPVLCARYHCDKHVVKMILEHTQMFCTVARKYGQTPKYKPTHANHPCTLWLEESQANWMWLYKMTQALHLEWQYRYDKGVDHKSMAVLESLHMPDLPNTVEPTPFAQCVPEEYRGDDPIEAYRKYYYYVKGERMTLCWTHRGAPGWYVRECLLSKIRAKYS